MLFPARQSAPPDRSNDRAVLQDLYERYGAAVQSRCVYLLKDPHDAEDALHDIFAKAFGHLKERRDEGASLGWLLGIATNHCLNVIRSQNPRWREEMERRTHLRPVGEGGTPQLEGRNLVRALLGRFDEETQRAAIHYYVDEMTLDEVAQTIGRSVPTVRKRLQAFAETAKAELAKWEAS